MIFLFITIGPNRCLEYLTRQSEKIGLQIIDLKTEIIGDQKALEQQILDINPDIILVYRCPYILPKHIYSKASLGAYNIHPSLLPKYPGLNPWNDIFKNKEKISGVTLHRITEIVDGGEIISQESFFIKETDTIEDARNSADSIAANLVEKFLYKLRCF